MLAIAFDDRSEPSPQDLGNTHICKAPETALLARTGGRPRLTKGGQLRLRHSAMEQDCNCAFLYWPCALPDKKNGATAPAMANDRHMTL